MSKDKIILPLDVDTAEKAVEMVTLLKDDVGAFKVGLELVNSAGLGVFEQIRKAGAEADLLRLQVPRHPQHRRGRVARGGEAGRLDVQRPLRGRG